MSIKTTRDEQRNLTTLVVTGPVSEKKMHEALDGSYHSGPTRLMLWDMSCADVSTVTSEVLRKFVSRAAKLGVRRQGGRTAVIAPEDVQFGLARMSEYFSGLESAPYMFRAFRTRDEALLWLKSDDPA